MRRRLDLAVSLIATPPVLFLDEPTTGLDPRSRVELWEVLRDLVRDGTTLLLTTQYLEEADQLADDIVVIDHGTVIAHGTPLQLKDASGRAALVVTVSRPDDLAAGGRPAATRRLRAPRRRAHPHADRAGRGARRRHPGRDPVRRLRHRARRPRAAATQPRRRLPAPDRPPRRGDPRPRRRSRHEHRHDDQPRPAPHARPARDPADQPAQPVAGDHAAQPDPHPADAGDAARRHDPAGDVRAAVRLRLRRRDRDRRARRLQRVAARRDHGPDHRLRVVHRRRRAHRRHRQGHRRPDAVAADPPLRRPGRPEHLQPDPLQHRHRRDVADRPADRLADPRLVPRGGRAPTGCCCSGASP